MTSIPDRWNLQKRRAERKRTDRSLENFTTNSVQLSINSDSNCRSRMNSVFKLKLRNLHEIRNSKKMSQSMVRSYKWELASESNKGYDTTSKEESPIIKNCDNIKRNSNSSIRSMEPIEINWNKSRVKSSKSTKAEDVGFLSGIIKQSIHEIITPVVQISYNQIKNSKSSHDFNQLKFKSAQSLSRERSNLSELLQKANRLSK